AAIFHLIALTGAELRETKNTDGEQFANIKIIEHLICVMKPANHGSSSGMTSGSFNRPPDNAPHGVSLSGNYYDVVGEREIAFPSQASCSCTNRSTLFEAPKSLTKLY
ncbi:hypothetical protein BaRGS_00023724, partial [Batillaria attramentaria]